MAPIIFIIVAILVLLGILRYNIRLKGQAKQCSVEAKRFHKKLQLLSASDHLFTDEELRDLKIEFAPVLDTVNSLYESHFISNEYLDNLGLNDFMDERKLLNHKQYINNQAHKTPAP